MVGLPHDSFSSNMIEFQHTEPQMNRLISNVFFGWPGNQYELEQIIDHM